MITISTAITLSTGIEERQALALLLSSRLVEGAAPLWPDVQMNALMGGRNTIPTILGSVVSSGLSARKAEPCCDFC